MGFSMKPNQVGLSSRHRDRRDQEEGVILKGKINQTKKGIKRKRRRRRRLKKKPRRQHRLCMHNR